MSGFILLKTQNPGITDLTLIFWSTLFIYQINTRLSISGTRKGLSNFTSISRTRFFLLSLIAVIIAIHSIYLNFETLLYLAHLGILAILYNVDVFQQKIRHIPFRSIPVLKIFLIAYVWASISTVYPLLISGIPLPSSGILPLFTAHFLFILAITLPFDIRDFYTDSKNALITFPGIIGIRLTKLLALFCLAIFVILHLVNWHCRMIPILGIITGYLIINATAKKNYFYYLFWLDGTILIYFIIVKFVDI